MNSWCTLFRICQQSVCVCCLEVKNNFLAHTAMCNSGCMTTRERLTDNIFPVWSDLGYNVMKGLNSLNRYKQVLL